MFNGQCSQMSIGHQIRGGFAIDKQLSEHVPVVFCRNHYSCAGLVEPVLDACGGLVEAVDDYRLAETLAAEGLEERPECVALLAGLGGPGVSVTISPGSELEKQCGDALVGAGDAPAAGEEEVGQGRVPQDKIGEDGCLARARRPADQQAAVSLHHEPLELPSHIVAPDDTLMQPSELGEIRRLGRRRGGILHDGLGTCFRELGIDAAEEADHVVLSSVLIVPADKDDPVS